MRLCQSNQIQRSKSKSKYDVPVSASDIYLGTFLPLPLISYPNRLSEAYGKFDVFVCAMQAVVFNALQWPSSTSSGKVGTANRIGTAEDEVSAAVT